MNTERKEIIQVNGVTIVVIMAIIGNILAVGFVYRWHQWQLFLQEKKNNRAFTQVVREEHTVKRSIQKLEDAPNWESTLYVKYRGNEGADDYIRLFGADESGTLEAVNTGE